MTCSGCGGYWSTWVAQDLDKGKRQWKTLDNGVELCGLFRCQDACKAREAVITAAKKATKAAKSKKRAQASVSGAASPAPKKGKKNSKSSKSKLSKTKTRASTPREKASVQVTSAKPKTQLHSSLLRANPGVSVHRVGKRSDA